MTLITNEIYFIDGDIKKSLIVSSADTRITYRKISNSKKKYKSGQKLFKIEYLNAVVSFWGSLNILNENGKEELLCTWLPKFIRNRHYHNELIEFVNDLREVLNQRMYKSYLIEEPSGFHLLDIKLMELQNLYIFLIVPGILKKVNMRIYLTNIKCHLMIF